MMASQIKSQTSITPKSNKKKSQTSITPKSVLKFPDPPPKSVRSISPIAKKMARSVSPMRKFSPPGVFEKGSVIIPTSPASSPPPNISSGISPKSCTKLRSSQSGRILTASIFLHDFPFYEGPSPTLGCAFYNGRWKDCGFREPLYAIPQTSDGTRRRHWFLTKLYAVLCAKFGVMSLTVGLFAVLASDEKKLAIQNKGSEHAKSSSAVFAAFTCIISVLLFSAKWKPRWRRRPYATFLLIIMAALIGCGFAISNATILKAFDKCERIEEQGHCYEAKDFRKISAKDAAIGLLQLAVGTLLVLLFSLQMKIPFTSLLGFMTVVTLHLATDFVCVLIHFTVQRNKTWPSIKTGSFVLVVAVWIYIDVRRMMTDERIAVEEHEYLFAAFQLDIDTIYFPWYMWKANRACVGYLIGSCWCHRLRDRFIRTASPHTIGLYMVQIMNINKKNVNLKAITKRKKG